MLRGPNDSLLPTYLSSQKNPPMNDSQLTASYYSRGRSRSSTRYSRSRSRSRSASVDLLPRRRTRFSTRPRIYGMINSPRTVYSFKRTVIAGLKLNTSTGFTTYTAGANQAGGIGSGLVGQAYGLAFLFSLNGMTITSNNQSGYNLPANGDFTALFDSWRIRKVVLKIVYNQNIASNTTPGTPLPVIQHCPDQDDSTPPTSGTELLQRPEMKVVEYGAGSENLIKYFTIYPQAKLATDPTGVVATTLAARSQFFDCNEPGVANYGFKMWFDTTRTAAADMGDLLVYADIYYDFKGVR